MKISQLSKITGASIRSIRHYEKKNLITAARLDNGYREFNESAIDRIKSIQIYLGLGLTTDQIQEIFHSHNDDIPPSYDGLCEEMLKVYEEKRDEINRRLNELYKVKERLEQQISRFEKNPSR